jgi:hypothetical protein
MTIYYTLDDHSLTVAIRENSIRFRIYCTSTIITNSQMVLDIEVQTDNSTSS